MNRRQILLRIRDMDEYEFENLIADIWEHRGWNTSVTRGSNDRGVDVIAKKTRPFDQKQLIQAKRYSVDNKIGSPEIQQYSSLRHQEDGVDTVAIVTSSSFTTEAQRTAKDLNVRLLSGEGLVDVLIEDCPESFVSDYVETTEHGGTGGYEPTPDAESHSTENGPTDKEDSIYPRSFQRGSKTKIFGDYCPMCGEKSTIRAGKTVNTDPLLLCEQCGTKWSKKEVKTGLIFGSKHAEWSAIGMDMQMKAEDWKRMSGDGG